jgi:pimeloyl-ACP methyl ester carboxylesterase
MFGMEWTRSRIAVSEGIELAYEEIGAPDAPVILLIMGYASQLIVWPESFCHRLADGGYRVIRFDNRDVGLSTKLNDAAVPNVIALRLRQQLKLPLKVAYTLDDMTADTVALLDALSISSAHIVGASMGGMIAQLLAVNYPERVNSLVSLMSSSSYGGMKPKILWHILNKASPDRDAQIAHSLKTWQLISSPELGDPVQQQRARIETAYERAEGGKRYRSSYSQRALGIGGGNGARLARGAFRKIGEFNIGPCAGQNANGVNAGESSQAR